MAEKFSEASEQYVQTQEFKMQPGKIEVTARGGGAAKRGLKATWVGPKEPTKGPQRDDLGT